MREGWKIETLGSVCHIKPSKKEAKQRLNGNDLVSFVPMNNLGERQKIISLNNKKPLNEVIGSYTYFAENDVLLAKITPCFENGKLGIARNLANGVGFGSSEYIVFRSKGDIDPEYLFYFLSQDSFLDAGARVMSGAVGHKRVPKEFIETYPIPIPSLPEQKRIVAILDEAFEGIRRAVANAEKNLANARELFESYLNAVFIQKGEGWVDIPIGKFAEVFDGPHATPKTIDTGPIFLGISALQDGVINLGKTRHVTEADFEKWTKRVKPQENDVVFSYETRLGQAAIIPKGLECCLGRRMGLVRLDHKIIKPEFFLYQYISPIYRRFLSARTIRGATVDRIPLKEFPSFLMSVPKLNEQQQIIVKLDYIASQIEKNKTIYQQKLTTLAELKQSLMQKAFTGELTAKPETVLKDEAVA